MSAQPATKAQPRCSVIRSVESYKGKQGPSYAGGVSSETVGSRAIWLGKITMAPGTRTKAHFHEDHETAMFVVSGEADLWFGEELSERETLRPGDYLYIPAGVSHVAVNHSSTEPLVVIAGRTDPAEQESVILQPDLDSLVPATV